MSNRLPDSKRNELIAEYNEGKVNADYEVIPSKTQKGKYTVRRRKVSLPDTSTPLAEPETPTELDPEPDNEDTTEDYSPFPYQFSEEMMYRQYQAQLNQMMLEQMKLLRQNVKWNKRKQQKIKDKTNKIYGIISDAVNRNTREPEPEPEPEPPAETEPPADNEPEPPAEPESDNEELTAPLAEPVYAQDYERDIDEMAGTIYKPYSRKDRIKWDNFNI